MENASSCAENGYNGAIHKKIVQNSLSTMKETENMIVKMDMRKRQEAKMSKIKSLC